MVARISGFFLTGIGVLLLALGLLFVVGSAGQSSRFIIAFVFGGVGLTTTAIGIALHLIADRREPERIKGEILAEAKKRNGLVTEPELVALLGSRWSRGSDVLQTLEEEGQCLQRKDGATVTWMFPSLQSRLAVRECEHCGGSVPLGDEVTTCPSCGGALTTAVKRVELADEDAYAMDE